MLSLYEILKASKTGIAPDMWTALAGMNWGGADSGAEVKELTGIPPLSFRADGTPLLDYLISGNMSQTGTPTSSDPIQPQETGERTGQIIEYPYFNESGTINGVQWTISENGHIKGVGTTSGGANFYLNQNFFLKAGTYTLKIYGKHEGMVFRLYDSVNTTVIATILQSNTDSFTTFTLDSDTSNECRIYFNVGSAGTNVDIDCDVMLNTGSTALPYEPYGYKIPISYGGENLWDEMYAGISTSLIYLPLYVGNGEFTLSTSTPSASAGASLFLLAGNVSSGASTSNNGVSNNVSRTVSSIDGYITVAYRVTPDISPQNYQTMLNRGSTALPYEPYNRTTTPVYLGEVETTRKIGKIVFVGSEDENWSAQAAGGDATRFKYTLANSVQADTAHLTSICTHLPLGVEGGTWNTDNVYTISNNYLWLRLDSSFTTVSALKAYLSQQHANGTPVTVWYVLATPTTGIVNEPLMKIGDYADTLSYEQAQVSIPTLHGNTVIDVLTELKPSEMYIKYQE